MTTPVVAAGAAAAMTAVRTYFSRGVETRGEDPISSNGTDQPPLAVESHGTS